jgi:mitochondrial fission protein ELM1
VSTTRVWVLSAGRPGDDAQAARLAEAVGWPWAVRPLDAAPAPPWPDVVIASGRRTEARARRIAARAGGAVRLVQVGRPHGPLAGLDLVVLPPQYTMPDHPRVVRLTLPLQRVSREAIARAAAAWAPPAGRALPRPWIAVLVGGDARPWVLDAAAARELGARVSAAAVAAGGSLLVTTSRRTAAAAADALAASLAAPAVLHRWRADARANPYLAFLGAADRIVVTADSASMLADAVSVGVPVEIFTPSRARRRRLRDAVRRLAWDRAGGVALPLVARLGIRPLRDLSRLHRALYARGLAAPLGAQPAPAAPAPTVDELAAVAARVRALAR